MIQMTNDQFDRLLLSLIDIHAKNYPHVDAELAGARARLKRHLLKHIGTCPQCGHADCPDNPETPPQKEGGFLTCPQDGSFWVEDKHADAICSHCGGIVQSPYRGFEEHHGADDAETAPTPGPHVQAYICNNRCYGTRFWVEGMDGDAVCPRCGDLCGMP